MPRYGFNDYVIKDDYIILRCYGNKKEYELYIDKQDLDKVKKFGRISITSAGYPTNSKHNLLHRYLTNCPKSLHVDHINRNPLDNRRCNLRVVSRSINQLNRGKQSNNKSNITGVHRNSNGWRATFQYKGKAYRKYFTNFEDAVMYRQKLIALYSPIGGVL